MLSKKLLTLIGFGWLMVGVLMTPVYLTSGMAKNIENLFVIASLAIISFSMAHLAPHLQRKDERIKFIRQKGALYTAILTIIYCVVLWLLLQFEMIGIEVKQIILILLSLVSSTLFVSWLVLSKKY